MRLDKITIKYEQNTVFKDFSADLDAKVVCISGKSGSGKTTLMKAIAGLVMLAGGQIEGKPRKPAFMFQEDRLFPWLTVYKNITAVLEKRDYCKADAMLSGMELSEVRDSYPSELSGGMRRRVALARTLAYGGDIILLDEPFNGMDWPLIKRIAPLILEMPQNIIISTHSKDEIELMGAAVIQI